MVTLDCLSTAPTASGRCGTTLMTLEGPSVVVRGRHHGEKHEQRYPIVEIVLKALAAGQLDDGSKRQLLTALGGA